VKGRFRSGAMEEIVKRKREGWKGREAKAETSRDGATKNGGTRAGISKGPPRVDSRLA
jgi:hypothetical protein